MKLVTNGKEYPCDAWPTLRGNTLRFALSAAPETLGETVVLKTDSGEELRTINVKDYLRWYMDGTVLNITNVPEPTVQKPEEPTAEEIAAELEARKSTKINNLSTICETTINAGTDITLTNGETHHFGYDSHDQANIAEMFTALALGATCYPYHYDNGNCTVYKAADITTIYITLAEYKTEQTTYYNQLKQYVKTLATAEEVEAVTYGQALTGDYLVTYNAMITTAQAQMQTVLEKLTGGVTA